MLESLTLENFLSFRDRTEFNFLATTEKPKKDFENIKWFRTINNKKILKSIFLFGNNGSGKSNFLFALRILRNLIITTRDSKNPDNDILPETYFKFEEASSRKPSTIIAVFHLSSYRYSYTISWDSKTIVFEELKRSSGRKREELIYTRFFDEAKDVVVIKFPVKSSISKQAQRIIRENVIRNTSVISIYDNKNFESEDISLIYAFFENRFDFSGLDDARLDLCSMLTMRDNPEEMHDLVCEMLKCLGSNIRDFRVDSIPKKVDPKIADMFIKTFGLDVFNERYPEGMMIEKYLRLAHDSMDPRNSKDPYIWLTEGDESRGTINMIRLLIILIDSARKNTFVTIDECAMGIHQETFNRIIQFYLAISDKAQAFLATQALPVLDMEGFRRDTARFFDKDFKTGISRVESVNLRKFHANKNIYKNYVDHAFGGKPYIPSHEEWMMKLSSYQNKIQDTEGSF